MSLKDRLIQEIKASGPIPVAAYMQTCLHDPAEGYYATRPGLGRDFATAPEISQVFGELVGLWAAHEWRAMGSPDPLHLVELGPGRGTLMADALRATRGVAGFHDAINLTLVEASPTLRRTQAQSLAAYAPTFAAGIETAPAGPAIIIANEFLDCLPVRQYVRAGGTWSEKAVGIGEDGALAFGLSPAGPAEAGASTQDALEVQPGLDGLVAALAARAEGGAPFRALFIDYGPADARPEDTLRAYRDGRQVDPLAHPGETDLTVDVDFGRLARLARTASLSASAPVPQGRWLMALGAQERLNALLLSNPGSAKEIHQALARLIDPADMGERFKAICLSSPDLPAPAAFGDPT